MVVVLGAGFIALLLYGIVSGYKSAPSSISTPNPIASFQSSPPKTVPIMPVVAIAATATVGFVVLICVAISALAKKSRRDLKEIHAPSNQLPYTRPQKLLNASHGERAAMATIPEYEVIK